MEKKLAKRKTHHRKYKHVASALAGVAIMAGTAMHGFSGTAEAAVKPIIPPIPTELTTLIDKDATKPVEPGTVATDPVATPDKGDKNKDEKPGDRDKWDKKHDRYDHKQYEHEKWADRGHSFHQRMAWYNNSLNKIQIYYNHATPVDIVMAAADNLGFDVDNDTFSLISQNGSQSIVRVLHEGNNYDITVNHLSNGNWQLTMVNEVVR